MITTSRLASHQLRNSFDQYVRCLQRLDATHEQDHLNVLRYPQMSPRLRRIAGMEGVQVDARRNDHDLGVLRAVIRPEFGRFIAGAGSEHVGRLNDRGLAAYAYMWLG